MKYIVVIATAILAGIAMAQTIGTRDIYQGSATEKKGMVVAGISDRINPIVVQAEAAYRRNTSFASPVFVQGDVQDAINKALGMRVSMFFQIDSVSQEAGRAVATARVDVRSKPVWTSAEQSEFDTANKRLDWLMANKPRSGESTTEYNRSVSDVKKRIGDIKRTADANAKGRAPDAVVKVEFDTMPANIKVGAKVTLMGWVKSVKVEPAFVDRIPYAKVTMTVQHEDARVYGEAATQPDEPATRPVLADSLGAPQKPAVTAATQPGALYFGAPPKAEAATQPTE